MGLGVLHGLDMAINLCRHHPRLARHIATDHQHHTKLTHGVGKAQDGGGDHARSRQGQSHGEESIQRACAQGGRHFHRSPAHGFKRMLQRLHRKRQ